MIRHARRQWFLVALAAVLTAGALWHEPLRPLADRIPGDTLVAAILIAMSAPLDLRKALRGRHALTAVAVGAGVNALAAGPLAWVAGGMLAPPLAVGLVVAALAPCTQASAAIGTRRGGGNEGVALAVTLVTNLSSFVTIPVGTWLLLGSEHRVEPMGLATRLLAIVVLPVAVGQAIRLAPVCRLGCDRWRRELGLAAQGGLLAMVFVGAVRCGELLEDPATRLGPAEWGALVLAAGGVHVALFALGWRLARLGGAEPGDALAAAVAGSQKTLAVGLGVALEFGPLAVLPMIVYHALQLTLDAYLVGRVGIGGEGTTTG